MKFFKQAAGGILLFAVLACGSEAQTPTHVSSEPTEEAAVPVDYSAANQKVDKFFAGFVGEDTPGGSVIVLQNGQVLYHAAYGLANLEDGTPLTTDYAFHIASMGKQMTALGIMMLHEEGKLNYDDPTGNYVPEVAQFGEDFTIRQLLHHTSGLPDYDDNMLNAMYALSDTPTNEDLVAALSEMTELPAVPGDRFEYSNPGYDLLAVIIERVSGEAFPDFVQKRIFDAVGMSHTFSLPNETRRADPLVAMSYAGESGTPEAYPYDDLDNLYGSGSIYSTTGDMAIYDEALYTDKLVSQSTLIEAFQPAKLNSGSLEPYGFGWELEEWNGENYVAHSGAWLGFNSDYVRFPERHFSVIVLLNRDYDYPDDPRIALQIAEFYLNP
jgi:CubicO group peptidase (beta-lactamase class C family)